MEKRLKIGIVTDQLLAGGVQLAAIEQVRELNKLGHKAKLLILMRKKYPTDFSYLAKDIPHAYLSDSYPSLFRKTIKFPFFSFLSTLHLISPILAPKIIKEEDYDILVSLGTTTCLTTQAIYRTLHIPYIAVIHDPIVYILEKAYSKTTLKYFFPILKRIAVFFERSFVKDARQTVIISRVHYNYLKRNYGIEPKILSFGTKTLGKTPAKRGNTLLSFGRWQKEKNPEFLLDIIKGMPKAKLIIAGTWTNQDELKKFREKVKKEKLSSNITIVPHYDERELETLCINARLFVHPHFEAFGLAALEAAGHGLPIIIPEKSGVTEMFTHGIHGFFPKSIELAEYKKYVKDLLSNERRAYKMGRAAYFQVRKKYSWESNAKGLLDVIYSVLTGKQKIIVLETGHALGIPLAGGDSLMEPMAMRLNNQFDFAIIVSSVGARHWNHAPFSKELTVLPHTRLDNSGKPIQIFITYCARMWHTINILRKQIASNNLDNTIIYSSTNILPDILPAYFTKKRFHKILWLARIHHLIPSPHKREGKFIVNLISYFMQLIAIYMIKSQADVVVALNKTLEKDLQTMNFPKQKLKVLGGGIDFEKISSINAKQKTKFDAIFLGRFHITKGIFDTIPIWKEVYQRFPNATLAIIGDGPPEVKKELEEKIKNAYLSKNIHVLGYLPSPKLYTTMKQSKLFLFLDHEAGWGLAVAEAMACKLPVIGYDIGVLGTIFTSGFVKAPLGDYKGIADKVIYLLVGKRDRLLLAQKAYREAAQFDWSQTSKNFSTIIEELRN